MGVFICGTPSASARPQLSEGRAENLMKAMNEAALRLFSVRLKYLESSDRIFSSPRCNGSFQS